MERVERKDLYDNADANLEILIAMPVFPPSSRLSEPSKGPFNAEFGSQGTC